MLSLEKQGTSPADTLEVVLLRVTPEPEKLVCQAARGDYYHGFVGDEPFEKVMATIEGDTVDAKVQNLLELLLKRGHYGPWEHVSFTFGIKNMSRACMAQITRHRVASFDIQSQRYVNFGDQTPDAMCWPPSFTEGVVKAREHGRHEITMPVEERVRRVRAHYQAALDLYNDLVKAGVPKEDARMVLPEASRVNGTMTVNARSLMHILDMRAAGDAQWEVRLLADKLFELAKKEMPITFGFYEEHMHMRKNRLSP